MSTVHAPHHHTTAGRISRARVAVVLALVVAVVAAVVAAIALRTVDQTEMILAPAEVPPAAAPQALDRGHGDPCALRLDVSGGRMEGIDPANRCGDPSGTQRTGGRIPHA